jgi:hypothetical protein
MGTDYSTAIGCVALITLLLTAMVAYVLSRPSDLAPSKR